MDNFLLITEEESRGPNESNAIACCRQWNCCQVNL